MTRELALEAQEWYVLRNWLRSRENRLMYAVRSRSERWELVYELRRSIEDQIGETEETAATVQTVSLSDAEIARLERVLRWRALRLLLLPWRDRERREVRRLRRQLRDQLDPP